MIVHAEVSTAHMYSATAFIVPVVVHAEVETAHMEEETSHTEDGVAHIVPVKCAWKIQCPTWRMKHPTRVLQ